MEVNIIRPRLKTFDLTIIVISLVIGMGIFRNPSEVALKAQLPVIFFSAWIIGAFISLIGALTFAEIGSRYPAPGGFYKIFSHCYHPAFAFMVNWITVLSNAASTGLVAIMGSAYIAPILLPSWSPEEAVALISIASIVLIYFIHLLGISVSARTLTVLMFIKMGMLTLLILALFIVDPAPTNTDVSVSPASVDWIKAFALCFIPVFFTYGGYQQTINFGGDVQNPVRNIPKGICIGISVVLFFYLAVNYSCYKVLGFYGLGHTTTLAADITGLMFGNIANKLVSVIMFFAVMAYVNVSIMSNPRVYYAMAEDNVLPEIFKKVNQKTQVQVFGVTVFCFVMILSILLIKTFQGILEYVMFFDSISLIAAAAAIFILRKREKDSPGAAGDIFRMKGYPWLPSLYILVYVIVNLSVLLSNPGTSLNGLVLFLIGLPVFYFLQWIMKNKLKLKS